MAHRDYSLQGAPVEVWMYDDRMEIRSPGLPPAPVTIETLNRREPLHLSRNPLLVRVLTDLQYMRDRGAGPCTTPVNVLCISLGMHPKIVRLIHRHLKLMH